MGKFGSWDEPERTSAPNHGKRKFLRALPHAGDQCAGECCDSKRIENGNARVSVNWDRDYPPLFYAAVVPPEPEEPIDWKKFFEDEGWDDEDS